MSESSNGDKPAYLRARQATLRARGKCIQCGLRKVGQRKDGLPPYAKCDHCRHEHAAYVQARRTGQPTGRAVRRRRGGFLPPSPVTEFHLTPFAEALLAATP